jgi:hypothetical protein
VYEIPQNEKAQKKKYFDYMKTPAFYILLIPALIGILTHLPLFLISWLFTTTRFSNSGHYDSIETAVLVIGYPIFLVASVILLFPFVHFWSLILLLLLPLTARAAMLVKYHFDI